MNRFAALLDRLAYEPSRNAKLRLMTDYFRARPIRIAAMRSRRSPARCRSATPRPASSAR